MKTYLKDLTLEEIIKRLKNEEVIYFDLAKQVHIKMIDGIICKFFGAKDVEINHFFSMTDSSYYFETEEPFEIKETGLYKTRSGRKVFVSDISKKPNRIYKISGIIEGDALSSNWPVYGSETMGVVSNDIISKWEED